jgi:hypothetical protein
MVAPRATILAAVSDVEFATTLRVIQHTDRNLLS